MNIHFVQSINIRKQRRELLQFLFISLFKKYLFLFNLHSCFAAFMSVCQRVTDPLALVLQTFVNCQIVAENLS